MGLAPSTHLRRTCQDCVNGMNRMQPFAGDVSRGLCFGGDGSKVGVGAGTLFLRGPDKQPADGWRQMSAHQHQWAAVPGVSWPRGQPAGEGDRNLKFKFSNPPPVMVRWSEPDFRSGRSSKGTCNRWGGLCRQGNG